MASAFSEMSGGRIVLEGVCEDDNGFSEMGEETKEGCEESEMVSDVRFDEEGMSKVLQ